LPLDQAGQRAERARGILLGAGIGCVFFLTPLIGFLVALINGDGEHTEDPTATWLMACSAIGGVVLLLVSLLIGRLTADWWRPRMREMLPGGTPPVGLSAELPQEKSVSPRATEREAQRRYRMAKRVRRQLREARIFERRLDGGGTLLTEPILVLRGPRRGDFAIFDQEGNPLGSAVRVRDLTSEASANSWISEVRDSQGRPVLAIRLAARRRWPKSVPSKRGTYEICSPNGTKIAHVGQLTKRSSRVVTAGGDPVACLDEEDGMTISDADGRRVARITAKPGWYVVHCTAPVDEPLRSLLLAASIVWDDTRPENAA
jgi:hypothetical protein